MANPEHLKILGQGVDVWNNWRVGHPDVTPDLSGASLSGADLSGASLQGADLRNAYLADADLKDADLKDADLTNASLVRADLEGAFLASACFHQAELNAASLKNAFLRGANLAMASLRGANFEGAELSGVRMKLAFLEDVNFENAELTAADLTSACFRGANLKSAVLGGADLGRADLGGAHLDNAGFAYARFKQTNLIGLVYSDVHRPLDDGSERARPSVREQLNWSRLRQIGALPLFGVSYVALVLAIVVANGVGLLNTFLPRWITWGVAFGEEAGWLAEGFEAPSPIPEVPIPRRMTLIFASSLLLVVGTTLYKLACPQRVQEFSETQWVEEHGRPRLMYFAESWSRRWLQWPTLVCTAVGGALAVFLLGEKLWEAMRYVASYGSLS